MEKPEILYHGSPVPIDILEPRLGHDPNNPSDTPAIYATPNRDIALLHALGPKPGLKEYHWKWDRTPEGVWKAVYLTGEPNFGGEGYIYHLPGEHFERISDIEWKCLSKVRPSYCETIRVDDYRDLISFDKST